MVPLLKPQTFLGVSRFFFFVAVVLFIGVSFLGEKSMAIPGFPGGLIVYQGHLFALKGFVVFLGCHRVLPDSSPWVAVEPGRAAGLRGPCGGFQRHLLRLSSS